MMKRNVDMIKREARFLTTPWGRAAFYFFVGILMIAKGGILSIIAGIFLMLVGGVIYTSCRNAYAALNELHSQKYTEAILIAKFRAHDLNKDGQLDTKEFSEVGVFCDIE
jgi:COPI associated protein